MSSSSTPEVGATFVNIIETAPETQQQVIDILKEGTERVISRMPGFISVTLYAARDGRHVINLATWEHPEDVRNVQTDPESAAFAKRTAQIAEATPGLYTVVGRYR
ncbi:hypothetical protein GCM10009785_06320 [Brooklawnia cerclae]|uniref:Heme-degrading monooxygenase HmoA n=1 Tax=Brooklawnia cerclae TaxID=349934 RepID=A0ABX0SGW8_9ACTN|nr:antibiotic biosynthesis monooxygenase [Brooklawnia cerclae]NIH56445.1 heme-degrading monooxygenase HmoA [Brooklawnia cerclae]